MRLIIIFGAFSIFWGCGGTPVATPNSTTTTTPQSQTITPLRYEAPDDCQWWLRESNYASGEEVALTCNLRTINSEFETSNFSVIPSEHTTSLKIECNGDLMSRSSLNDKSFAHLTRLRELILDYCKLGKWPSGTLVGLRDLRNLTIRTHNMDWPTISLDLSPESFYPVKQLERLDISTNNIWSFTENIFCPLTNLVSLNVSENRLQDVGDLGFREKAPSAQALVFQDDEPVAEEKPNVAATGCNLNIRILDASFNHFVLLPSNGFSVLKQLQELRVHDNEISMVADKALGGLKNLKLLDLSNNKIVSLPLELFRECADSIKEIYLQNNSISVLSPRLFSDLNQLLSLDLSSNQLTSAWINNETFSGLIRLVLLNLSRNRITKLDPTLFHDLYTLQILNLEHNLLESIPADTFTALNNLHTLVLSFNRIKYLEAYSLNGLYALSLLSIDYNRLESLHANSLRNCTSLQDLNLSGNKFTEVPTALKEMRLLKTLDLGENLITNLEKPGFKGMTNLYGLRLIANQITTVGKKSLLELPSLQILNLSQNRIKSVEKGAFATNTKLEAVRVDSNVLTSIDGIFKDVPSLVWLNVSGNRLQDFDYGMFPANLLWLDVHGNLIEHLNNQHRVKTSIQTLDASFNKLAKIVTTSIPDSVELLFLNDNRITFVEPHTFANKANLTRVDMYANEISNLDLAALQLSSVPQDRPLPEFYIGGNPFHCDCTMEWLQRINKLEIRQHPVIMDIESIYCKLVYDRERKFIPLTEAQPSQFLCSYKSHCYTLCQCCPFDACDCEMNCPTDCSCYHDQSWSANIVDCSRSNYTEMPNKIPMDATEVYLDGNNFGELTSHSFIGRKNLRNLYVNNSNIAAIYNYTFSGIGKLITLHLEDNRIKILQGFEFASLVGLKELYLQNNRISAIDSRTFVNLKNLEILRLDGNRIYKFEVWQFIANPYLISVSLARNSWSCDCQFINEFRLWIQENFAKISDIDTISCMYNNETNPLGSFLKNVNNTSCITFFGSLAENQMLRDYLPFLLLTSTIFIVVLVITMAVFLYKKELHICMYTRCGFRSCYKSTTFGDDTDHERLFDAYVAYCIKDEDFITQILCPSLEQCDAPYRLCLHYRDFNINSYIADTIIEAAESSKRTVIVLSKNFLQTEWCRFEYKSALREVLRDRRNKIVFVLLGEIPQRDLDPDLRLYLKINTCIQWGDNLFWQKLKYFMPNVKENASTFIISSRNSTNVYATPFNYYNNTMDRSRCSNYPTIPPPPPNPPGKLCNQYTNSLMRNGGSHISLDKNVNLQPLWT
ncbi:toll-like receptor 6 [Planococcus citri]|uniref:toll-like receptor 6 n=1 Tax=Planococcus citri TaxID=170843 RepID=UPI0031F85A4C